MSQPKAWLYSETSFEDDSVTNRRYLKPQDNFPLVKNEMATTLEDSLAVSCKIYNMIQQTHYLVFVETCIPLKKLLTDVYVVVLFVIVKTWKQPKCPSVNECINKLWYIQTMEY